MGVALCILFRIAQSILCRPSENRGLSPIIRRPIIRRSPIIRVGAHPACRQTYPVLSNFLSRMWSIICCFISRSLTLIFAAFPLPIRMRIFWPAERASSLGSAN